MTAACNKNLPKTAVLHQLAGIGDLIFHLPYFKAIAGQSQNGKVSVIASPSTCAAEILAAEPWVEEVIYYDHHPRKVEKRKGRHSGIAGLWRMARELRERRFGRIVLFSGKFNRGLLAWLAGIPVRIGYGFNCLQRIFLNQPPGISPYQGQSLCVYHEATSLALAHNFCTQAMSPRMTVSPQLVETVKPLLADLPRPLYAFAIGTSAPAKQWGVANFAELARRLIERGNGVVLLGGPRETVLGEEIERTLSPVQREAIRSLTKGSVMESAAALCLADACIGNDTGVVNMAAACNRPSYVLIGARPILDQDPLLHMLQAPVLSAISVDDVLNRLEQSQAPGFAEPQPTLRQ